MSSRMNYCMIDEAGLLAVEYTLRIAFTFCPAEPRTHDDEGCPARVEDVHIVRITAEIGGTPVNLNNPVKHAEELRVFNDMLDEDSTFRDKVELAIAEHLREVDEAVKESAAEAKYQAKRDGE